MRTPMGIEFPWRITLCTVSSLGLPSPSRLCGQTSARTASRLICLQVSTFIRKSELLLALLTSLSSTRSTSVAQKKGGG